MVLCQTCHRWARLVRGRLLGSVSQDVLTRAHCPVAVVRSGHAES
ncbi:universal stress protein [Terrabacter sp. MAHUQ-38]|nr:universal stress protein [Terrabacter sp. MAHUQ-38]